MLTFSVFRMRMTSIITALPAPLSVAPVPACQESKCAPIITTSSAFLPPGISPTMLAEFTSASEACALSDTRTRTGVFFSMMRAIRLYCSAVITNVGGASGSALLCEPACSALVVPSCDRSSRVRMPNTPSSRKKRFRSVANAMRTSNISSNTDSGRDAMNFRSSSGSSGNFRSASFPEIFAACSDTLAMSASSASV